MFYGFMWLNVYVHGLMEGVPLCDRALHFSFKRHRADGTGPFPEFAKCFTAPVTWTSGHAFAFHADGHLVYDECFLSQIKSQQD